MTTILVTGGCGFIGSAVVRQLLAGQTDAQIVNVDALTYAANPATQRELARNARYRLEEADIADPAALTRIFEQHRPAGVVHLAAESHVDRSIDDAAAFLKTNVTGTAILLDCATAYWRTLSGTGREQFRFVHVSTDEVYGSLGPDGHSTEESAYAPNSPYAASKAASDHLARAWHRTHGLPVVVSNGSNTYGPYQFPEKLIPLMLVRAMTGESLPVYGKGDNVRDWLHVDDHAGALLALLQRGRPGEKYNVGGGNERRNLEVVQTLCRILDELAPDAHGPHARRIAFVADRPGHDLRYSIDTTKIRRELAWEPRQAFEAGLQATVAWYLANRPWWEPVLRQKYDGRRLGLGAAG
jgi:dTDP-glucose 4,6-dehydratase